METIKVKRNQNTVTPVSVSFNTNGTTYNLPEVVVTPQGNKDNGRHIPLYERQEQQKMNHAINSGMNKAGQMGFTLADMLGSAAFPAWGLTSGLIHGAMSAKDIKDNGLNWNNGLGAALGLGFTALHLPTVQRGVQTITRSSTSTKLTDYLRRQLFVNKKLGTYTPYKVGQKWEWDANGRMFGKRIGEGSEMDVFENSHNPNKVLKIQSDGYESLDILKKMVKDYQKRNLIPYQEESKFIGYMEGVDATTRTKQRFYPVFSQNKLKLEANTTPMYWNKVLVPKIDRMMQKAGYKGSAKTSYSNGKYTISDMSPYNIGYNKNGDLRFLDFYVE